MTPTLFIHSVHIAYNKLLVKSTRYLLIAMNVRVALVPLMIMDSEVV
jgi:hypothetical protein